jgi:hypothetical protein
MKKLRFSDVEEKAELEVRTKLAVAIREYLASLAQLWGLGENFWEAEPERAMATVAQVLVKNVYGGVSPARFGKRTDDNDPVLNVICEAARYLEGLQAPVVH